MSWDPRAERITARGQAAKDTAEAEAIRAQSNEDVAERREERRRQYRATRRTERRAARARCMGAVRRYAVPVGAVASPEVIAWSGQYSFGVDQMHLGWLAPLLPVALEGGVLYSAKLTFEAIDAGKPAGKYRAATWIQAAIAAAMNFWHGDSAYNLQVGVALGLTSLLGIVMLELTIALRRHKASGRTAEQIRQNLIRRLRYPRLSIQATAIAAARNLGSEEAWRAAWIDRYGLEPDSTRRDRRIARKVLTRQQKDARTAARNGGLTITALRSGAALETALDTTRDRDVESAPARWPLPTNGRALLPIVSIAERAVNSDPDAPVPVTPWPLPVNGRVLLPIIARPTTNPVRQAGEQGKQTRSRTRRPAHAKTRVRGVTSSRSTRRTASKTTSPRALSDDALRAQLMELIASEELAADPSVRSVQTALGIGFQRAKRVLSTNASDKEAA